ncbi:MAG: hypothetical protein WCI20_08060 [bacterium]
MIFVWMLFGGLAIGVGFALKIILGLILWGSTDSYVWAKQEQLSREEKAWLKTLPPSDREAFLLHERRKAQYIKLRNKFAYELQRRILREFRRVKPTIQVREILRQRIANALWVEWDMKSWDDINLAEDAPLGLPPSWGECPNEDKYLPPKPLWEPPPRSTYAIRRNRGDVRVRWQGQVVSG